MKISFAVLLAATCVLDASPCTTIVVGRRVSSTGHVIVGHNEDDPPPLWIRHGIVTAREWLAGTCLPASPGCCATIPQATHTFACYWGEVKTKYGDGCADTFLNENGVIVVSNSGGKSRERSDDLSMLTEGGVKFNLRRAVGERAISARDAVRIIGELVEKYGYAPSARIYTVADKDEAWLVQVVHGRNYVAVRCPDDEVAMMPNVYTVHETDAYSPNDIVMSSNLVSNAMRKGLWDGNGRFNFAKAYQGEISSDPNVQRDHEQNNADRFRLAIRIVTGEDWPSGKRFPFSVRPARSVFTPEDVKKVLSAHNGLLKDGKHEAGSNSICSESTIESSVCEFKSSPKDTVYHLSLGQGCKKPYIRLRPFIDPLPADIDDSATADARLASHVKPNR